MVFKDNAKKKNDDDCAHDSEGKPGRVLHAEETRRMCAGVFKGGDNKQRGHRVAAHFCETKEDERKQMYRELKEKDDIFVTLKREEEEDVDAYERAREEGADDDREASI